MATGRWSKLRHKLPAFEPEPGWQEQVDAAKKKLMSGARNPEAASTARLGRVFATTKRRKQTLEHKIKRLNVELEALSQVLVEALEDQELTKVELRGGVTLYISDEPYVTVENKQKMFRWIKANRAIYLLSIHHGALNAFVKDRLAAGMGAPAGAKVYMKTSIRAHGLRGNGVKDEEQS